MREKYNLISYCKMNLKQLQKRQRSQNYTASRIKQNDTLCPWRQENISYRENRNHWPQQQMVNRTHQDPKLLLIKIKPTKAQTVEWEKIFVYIYSIYLYIIHNYEYKCNPCPDT